MKDARLLIVDADAAAHPAYAQALDGFANCSVAFEAGLEGAERRVADETFDAVVIAIRPPDTSPLGFLAHVRGRDDMPPAVVVSDPATVESATAALRLGAADYLAAPLGKGALAATLGRLVEQRRLGAERELLLRQVERPYTFDDIMGTCPAMRKVFETIAQVADSGVDVLVVGETGTGKELVARSIHRRSRRAGRPFVPVDCGAIPENLLEAEFFGHEKGAFTGADTRTIGLLEFADGGTFFLDELGELPLLMQAKLLRTLQERRIRRVGGRQEIDVDVRIVAATARDLDVMAAAGQFRKDLYYRINVVRIDLPPLAARGDDLGLLAEYFAVKYSREMNKPLAGITPEAYQVLSHYRWPGNVRELQNVVRRALALSTDPMIGLDDLPDALVIAAGEDAATASGATGYFHLRDEHMARFERQYLGELLRRHAGDVKAAAFEAQLPRGTLYRLLKNHGLDPGAYRE
ncbi:MAG: sigma-54-dependent Fis family transcriptional regulator [Planctomycetia bacterium]|nr:sigma-54-dependent Fis family transcriptional regulator [Planctomycetia bacterium]